MYNTQFIYMYPSKWLNNQSTFYMQCSILVFGFLYDSHMPIVVDDCHRVCGTYENLTPPCNITRASALLALY